MATSIINKGAVFPFYNDKNKQQKYNCSICEGIISPVGTLPHFSICIGDMITVVPSFEVRNASNDNIVVSVPIGALVFKCRSDGKVFVQFTIDENFPCGVYYYQLDLNGQDYFSEVFIIQETLANGYLIEAVPNCNEKNGLLYLEGYTERFYFEAIEDYPSTFRQEVTTTNGDGEVSIKSHRTTSVRRLVFCNVFDSQLLGLTALRDFETITLTNLQTGESQEITNYQFSSIPDVKNCLSIGTISFEESALVGSGCCENEEEDFTYEDCPLPF